MVNLNKLLLRAQQIAREAHAGLKRDVSGEDYINHPERVSQCFANNIRLQIVAWLHDVVEDNPDWSLERLRAEGFPDSIITVLDAVTRRKMKGETYKDFIQRIQRHSAEAVKVKIADLNDNLTNLPLNDARHSRYTKALEELKS